jgi:hypothetical protein
MPVRVVPSVIILSLMCCVTPSLALAQSAPGQLRLFGQFMVEDTRDPGFDLAIGWPEGIPEPYSLYISELPDYATPYTPVAAVDVDVTYDSGFAPTYTPIKYLGIPLADVGMMRNEDQDDLLFRCPPTNEHGWLDCVVDFGTPAVVNALEGQTLTFTLWFRYWDADFEDYRWRVRDETYFESDASVNISCTVEGKENGAAICSFGITKFDDPIVRFVASGHIAAVDSWKRLGETSKMLVKEMSDIRIYLGEDVGCGSTDSNKNITIDYVCPPVSTIAHELGHVYYAYALDPSSWQASGAWSREVPQSNSCALTEGWCDFVRIGETDLKLPFQDMVYLTKTQITPVVSGRFEVIKLSNGTFPPVHDRKTWQQGNSSDVTLCMTSAQGTYTNDVAGWVSAAKDGSQMVVNNTTYFWNLYDRWVDSAVCDPLSGRWCDTIYLPFAAILNTLPGWSLANVHRVSERLVVRYPQWQAEVGSVEVLSCTFMSGL